MVRILIGLMATALMAGLVFWLGADSGPRTVSAFIDEDGKCVEGPAGFPQASFGFGYTGNQEINILVDGIHCVVELGSKVEGNIIVKDDGELTVLGTVEGNIKADTTGNITVNGTVEGNIVQKGSGDVTITSSAGGSTKVEGNVDVKGGGSVDIDASGAGSSTTVDGNVKENGDGSVTVTQSAGGSTTIEGNVEERGDGSCSIEVGVTVNGKTNKCT